MSDKECTKVWVVYQEAEIVDSVWDTEEGKDARVAELLGDNPDPYTKSCVDWEVFELNKPGGRA